MYEIRLATEQDYKPICNFFQKTTNQQGGMFIPYPWVKRWLHGDRKNKPISVMLALRESNVVAVAAMTNRRTIKTMLIHHSHRSNGLGTIMVNRLQPESVVATKQSLSFWQKFGIAIRITGGHNE